MIFVIAAKDLKTLFSSPLAWIILAILNLIIAYLFLSQIDAYLALQAQLAQLLNPPGVTEIVISPLFGGAAIVLMMVVPILSMRLLSEEKRHQTLTLLISAPVSMTEIVLGKFVGLMAFLLLVIGFLVIMSFSLYIGGTLDSGLIISNLTGIILLVASFAALSLYISSLTAHPMIAAIGGLGSLLGLWIINLSATDPASLLHTFSLIKHFESFNRGLLNTADIAFYIIFIVVFLVLAIRQLDKDRLRG
ncbi:ABC transporter permease [Sulfurirhabdus autotrophica]|uniref:ABC-2 type transport system permease protein n=1 Tax=Sulfurirhabdus autotrophica TaxID=1706046 RepID=A0A4R3XZC4_9PROT|nr:ABC transporter permease subunit [Sulfurirhabdus autotrophica]TCV84726.1 ABC-2 type transport system permease protein [Sulfurirhabdus autotrophica]